MPVKTDREYRAIDMAGIEVRRVEVENEADQMIVEGYATTFDQPYQLYKDEDGTVMEQVDRHAFDETDMSDVIMQYDHAGRVFARLKNDTLRLDPDDHGLKITANLGGTDIGKQLYQEIAGGYTDKMSFGFTVTGQKHSRSKGEDGKPIILRTITRIGKLFDVSAVSLPANDATEISARSISDGLIAEAKEELRAEEERKARIDEIRKILHGGDDK